MATETTTLFRARVPSARLHKAEKILHRLGMKTGDALNLLLAQIEIRGALPFEITTRPQALLTAEQQADEWNATLGAY